LADYAFYPVNECQVDAVTWTVSALPVPYLEAVQTDGRARRGDPSREAAEQVWLLEHSPLYTAERALRSTTFSMRGFPFSKADAAVSTPITVRTAGAYVMLDLKQRKPDARAFVRDLEQWLIRTLARFDVKGERRSGRVGIWVALPAARRQDRRDRRALETLVTFHGISINVDPDLSHYSGIVPCGVGAENLGVTSLAALGIAHR